MTQTESILGSPNYMAPEQAEGRAKEVGPAADIYALGANLYELLTGRPPFVGPTILATLDLVKNAEPVPPRHLQPGVSPDLETICLKCLRKEPRRGTNRPKRWPRTSALPRRRADPGAADAASGNVRWKWVRRRPAMAALVVVSTLSILAAAGGWLWYRADRERQRAAVRRRVEGVRAQVDHYILLGEEAMRRKDWDGARAQLGSALALIRTEPATGRDGRRACRGMLAKCDARIADRARRERRRRARLEAFQRSYDEAVFYQSQYTGLEPEANLRASRAAARQALEQFEPADGRRAGSLSAPVLSTRRRSRPSPRAITSWR